MSMEAMIWGAKLKVPSREKLVLMLMGNYANERAQCWPSYSTLAASCAVSVGTVKRALKQLEEWGLVEVQNRFHPNGKPRSNLYKLHLDRLAPPDALDGCTETPTPEDDEENAEETTTSEHEIGGTVQADSIHRGHSESIPRSHTDTKDGVTQTPTNRNNQLEPSPLNPPQCSEHPPTSRTSPPSQADDQPAREATATHATTAAASGNAQGSARQEKEADPRAGFNELERLYQQGSVIGFFGDRTRALKRWDRLSFEDRIAAVAKFPQYLSGSKAQFARWQSAKPSERGRKPQIASASDYLGTRIFASLPAPIQQPALPKPVNPAWCEAIRRASRSQFDADAVFVAQDSAAFADWIRAERRAGMTARGAQPFVKRDLGQEHQPVVWRGHGRFFTSEYPPQEEEFEDVRNEPVQQKETAA